MNENGTVRMKTKCAKHDQLVNQNLLVKYKKPISQETLPKEEAKPKAEEQEEQPKRKYAKRIFEGREDGGPKTRSKTAREVSKIQCKNALEVNNEFASRNVDVEITNLINSLELVDPITNFKKIFGNHKLICSKLTNKKLKIEF